MQPDSSIVNRAKKVVDAGMNIPLAQLTESIQLNEKLDELISKEYPEFPAFPEIPEYPTTIEVSNLPEIQRVELVNPPQEKDDKEQLALLKEIASELKKKEQLAYDIEIDATLKEQLRGEKGEPGLPGAPGINGNTITPIEVVDKLESLEGEERLDVSAVRGTESLIEDIATKIAKEEVKKVKKQYVSVGGALSTGGSGSQNLQEVTDIGATTTNTITISPSGNDGALIANGSGSGIGIDITHAGSGTKLNIGTTGAGDLIVAGSFNVDNSGNVVGNNLSGTNTGDQLMYGTIAVAGQSDLDPSSTGDTLTFVAGANVTLTTNAGTNELTIAATGGGGGGNLEGGSSSSVYGGTAAIDGGLSNSF